MPAPELWMRDRVGVFITGRERFFDRVLGDFEHRHDEDPLRLCGPGGKRAFGVFGVAGGVDKLTLAVFLSGWVVPMPGLVSASSVGLAW